MNASVDLRVREGDDEILRGVDMEYNVAAQLKIYVDDPKKIEAVKSSIERLAKINKAWEEEVAFGIKVLKVILLLNDAAGGMSELEEKVKRIPHVSEIEVEEVTRI
ncbi:MAG: hypothetical protein QXT45_00135 [Candidatus Bilamarchaeaceae archaeon]